MFTCTVCIEVDGFVGKYTDDVDTLSSVNLQQTLRLQQLTIQDRSNTYEYRKRNISQIALKSLWLLI